MKHLFKPGIRREIILPLSIIILVSIIVIYNFLIYKNEKNIVSSAEFFAKSNINQYLILRKYYSKRVIDTLEKYTNAKIDTALTYKKDTIPLPFTMIHDLSSLLNQSKEKITLKLYSNYPFENRKDRILDDFEKNSLKRLERTKTKSFTKRENYMGTDSVRVVVADILTDKSCVACHNYSQNSPKKDWKLNDLAGALEIIIPIDKLIQNNTKNTQQIVLFMFLILIILIYIIYTLINKRILISLEKIINFVKNIKQGELNNDLEIKQNNELKDLSEHINTMRLSLKNSLENLSNENIKRKDIQNELNILNNELEQKIDLRTFELKNSNNELEESITHLKNAQEQLIQSEKMASLGSLVAGVAHEVNTPIGIGLTSSTHFLDISKKLEKSFKNDELSQEDFIEYLSTSTQLAFLIDKNLQKASNLIKSFKQVSIDQSSEEKRKINFKYYLEEIILSLDSTLKQDKISITLICEDNITLYTQAGNISQVFNNLILNAKKHAFDNKKDNKKICIKVENKQDYLEILFEDNGEGIKEENIKKIYEPFFTTKRNQGGSGLGLNIVYTILKAKLKGDIKYISSKSGAKFLLKISKKT